MQKEKISLTSLQKYQQGDLVKFKDGVLIGTKATAEVFVIENGKKRHIPSEMVFSRMGYDWNNVVWIDLLTATAHEDGPELELPARLTTENITAQTDTAPETDGVQSPIDKSKGMYAISEDKTVYIGDKFSTGVNFNIFALIIALGGIFLLKDDFNELFKNKNKSYIKNYFHIILFVLAVFLIVIIRIIPYIKNSLLSPVYCRC